jgi:hypothetical protein
MTYSSQNFERNLGFFVVLGSFICAQEAKSMDEERYKPIIHALLNSPEPTHRPYHEDADYRYYREGFNYNKRTRQYEHLMDVFNWFEPPAPILPARPAPLQETPKSNK